MKPGRAGSVREAVLVFGGQLLAVVGTFASVRVLTELIPPGVYGELALALTATVLLNQTVFGPLTNGAMRFYATAVEKGSVPAFLSATWRLARLGIAVTAALFVTAAIGLVVLGYGALSLLILAVLAYTVTTGISSILTGIQNAARQRAVVALHQSLDSWVKVLITGALLVTFGVSSSTAMLGFAAAAALVLGSQYLFYRRLVGRSQHQASVEETWSREIRAPTEQLVCRRLPASDLGVPRQSGPPGNRPDPDAAWLWRPLSLAVRALLTPVGGARRQPRSAG